MLEAAVEPPKNTPETPPTERPESANAGFEATDAGQRSAGVPAREVGAALEAARALPQPAGAAPQAAQSDVLAYSGSDGSARTEVQAERAIKPADPWIGRVLDDRYRITERLGEGGMGAVFVAEHLKLRKSVALKVIRAELAGNGEVAVRFAREAMATAQFEHPHVASAIDYGTLPENGGAYLVMQLVRGQSLRDLLDTQGKLSWRLACELLAQVADALSAARGAGIVHRDLKPENIMVETREDGSRLAKILDFGIAHVPQASPSELASIELTRIGVIMGTPGYMSPEQAVGDKVDHRTDLYALGVVLWECIAGRSLWDGPDITSIITRQLRDEVPRLRELPHLRVPRALDELIQRLCARAADARPDHAGAVRDDLRALVHHPALPERPIAFVRDSWLSAQQLMLALPGQTRALLGLGAVAAVLGILALSSGSPPPPAAELTPLVVPAAPPPAGTTPSFMRRALDAAKRAFSDAPPAPSKPFVPAELVEPVKTMQDSTRSTERRKAAQRVLAYKGATRLPPYVRAIARLEEARSCRDRKDAIGAMISLGDRRCLDSVRRYAEASRTGCGFLSLEDCYSCFRSDARRAVTALAAKLAL